MEELIYQFQKLLKKMDDPKSDFPISTKYYLAVGIRETVRVQQLSTVLIKGRDNKAAFEECIERASTIYKQLQNHAEVRKAIEWADSQEEKRREQEKRERNIESLKAQIRKLEKSTLEPTFNAWLTRKFPPWRFIPGKTVVLVITSFLMLPCGCMGVLMIGQGSRDWPMGLVCLVPSLLYFLFLFALATCYFVYLPNKESIREELNRESYEEIDQLKAKLTRLRNPAGPKPRELTPSNEVIPSVELIPLSLPKPPLTIQFTCPSCKKTLKAPADKAGVEISCPGCKASMQIPSQ